MTILICFCFTLGVIGLIASIISFISDYRKHKGFIVQNYSLTDYISAVLKDVNLWYPNNVYPWYLKFSIYPVFLFYKFVWKGGL